MQPQPTIGSDVLKPVYSHLCSKLGETVVTVDSEAFTSLLWVSAMVWSRQTPQGAVLVAHTVQKQLLLAHMIRCVNLHVAVMDPGRWTSIYMALAQPLSLQRNQTRVHKHNQRNQTRTST